MTRFITTLGLGPRAQDGSLLWKIACIISVLIGFLPQNCQGHEFQDHASLANCTEIIYVEQPVDHFNGLANSPWATFKQRVCIHDAFRRPQDGEDIPMLFYTGNEGPVDLYVNNTGLMWSLGKELGAILVFAEHRYFGESFPNLDGMENCMAYVSSAQALADYAEVVPYVKSKLGIAHDAKVVAFGGSYGGMLAAYFRLRYPHVCNAGAVAGSAPVLGFATSRPALDGAYAAIAQGIEDSEGNFDQQCWDSFLSAWAVISLLYESKEGRDLIQKELGWCSPLPAADTLIATLQDVLFLLAESNFPFPSDYIVFATVNQRGYKLPAWPMRHVCAKVRQPKDRVSLVGDRSKVKFSVDLESGRIKLDIDWDQASLQSGATTVDLASLPIAQDLVKGIGEMYSMLYNITGTVKCYGGEATDGTSESPATLRMRQSLRPSVPSRTTIGRSSYTQKKMGNLRSPPAYKANSTENVCRVDHVEMLDGWGALVCNEGFFLVQYLLRGMGRDIYWPPSVSKEVLANSTYNDLVRAARAEASCSAFHEQGLYGVTSEAKLLDPLGLWPLAQYMGRDISRYGSNIIFSNGRYDPWSAAGVLESNEPRGIEAVFFEHGAHHTDFMFSNPDDPLSLRQGRAREISIIKSWLREGKPRQSTNDFLGDLLSMLSRSE